MMNVNTLCPRCVNLYIKDKGVEALGDEVRDLRDPKTQIELCWTHRNYAAFFEKQRALEATEAEYNKQTGN